MFSNLVESGPKPRRSVAQALCSLMFHVAVGVGAVEASRRVVPAEPPAPVIDTTIFVLEARRPPAVERAHAGFETSAIEAVRGARFRPARVRGRPVRQLVRQGMTFRIE